MTDKKSVADGILEKDILEILKSSGLNEEEKLQVYKKMLETIKNRAIDRILTILPDEKIKEWKRLLEEGDEVRLAQFLSDNGADTQKIMIEETMKYKLEVAALMEHLEKSGKSISEYYKAVDKKKDQE